MEDCLSGLENRGLEDQGMYRVVGVGSKVRLLQKKIVLMSNSKVTKLLTMGLDRRKAAQLNLDDAIEWETKTITSAVKTFFRNLPGIFLIFSLKWKERLL